jgi:hypothetical protein
MGISMTIVAGLAVCAMFLGIAFWSTRLGPKTCRECGSGLPVARVANAFRDSVGGEWSCPKCGTQFDRRGRARGQSPV